MPLYNDVGHPMPLRELTPIEQRRISQLSMLWYPEDKETIFHLSPKDFKDWIYLQNPRQALLLTSTHGINVQIQKQLNPSLTKLVRDFLWRIFN